MRKILCLLLLSVLITPAFAADWSMFKNDASHSGYTGDAVNTPLTLKWTKDLGYETDSSPVIVNDVLFIGSTIKPEETKKSPGFEYPVFFLLIVLAIGIYKKKK